MGTHPTEIADAFKNRTDENLPIRRAFAGTVREPREAVALLAPWVRQVHVKDALFTEKPGTWGTEVPWGDGAVGARAFIAELEKAGFTGNYVIEREGGDSRASDIGLAAERLMAAGR